MQLYFLFNIFIRLPSSNFALLSSHKNFQHPAFYSKELPELCFFTLFHHFKRLIIDVHINFMVLRLERSGDALYCPLFLPLIPENSIAFRRRFREVYSVDFEKPSCFCGACHNIVFSQKRWRVWRKESRGWSWTSRLKKF